MRRVRRTPPPRLLAFCIRRLLPAERVEDILGDLEERAPSERSRFFYWRQLIAFVLHLSIEAFRTTFSFASRPRAPRETTRAGLSAELAAAVRGAARRPGFTLLAAATLALGIGANGALFSLMDAIYFRALPLREPERLVRIEATSPKAFLGAISYLESTDFASACPALEEVVPVGSRGVTLHLDDASHILLIDYVSDNFFSAMGIPLSLGNGFVGDASTPQVVVNHQLWQERLGGRPDVIGAAIQLNDTLFTIVGVTPAGFVGLDRVVRTDVWVMIEHAPFVVPGLRNELENRHHRWFEVYARLAPDSRIEDARAQLESLARRWEGEDSENYPRAGFRATGLLEIQRERRAEGVVFLALPGLVLLIACANVANLLMARSEQRRRELAIRTAVGAGRARLLRQLVAESVVLAFLGTGVGVLLATWAVRLVPFLVPPGAITYTIDARIGLQVLFFCCGLALASALLLVLVQSARLLRYDVTTDLKTDGTPALGRARFRTQYAIVAMQTAVGVIVLAAVALMVRSLWHGITLWPGFDRDRQVATFYLVPALEGYDAAASHRFFEDWRQRVMALPGIERVSYAIRLPAQGNEAGWAQDVVVPGAEPPDGEDSFRIRYTMVGADYFDVIGTRILRGRGIVDADRPDSQPVVVINETMAKRFWPGADPVGETIVMGKSDPTERRIVGVAEDIKIADLYEAPEMYVYVPYAQDPQGFGLLLVESSLDDERVTGSVTETIRRASPDVPVLEIASLDRHMELVLFEERRDAWVAIGVGLIAVALTAGGIYGLVSLITIAGTKEFGIRAALGASGGAIAWLVIRKGLAPTLLGTSVGIGLGLLATRALESRVHGIGTDDPLSFIAGALVVVITVLIACAGPARRAARLDPKTAMRHE